MSKEAADRKRTFSYDEASALLPEVRRLTEEAYRSAEALGPDAAATKGEELTQIVTGWAEAILARGIKVKGLWLVDFDNGEGYYCWRWPEETLSHYHGYDDGFAGRIKIH
jgi:hypothetical protein